MTTKAVDIRTPQDLVEFARGESFQQQIELALPEGMDPRRFGRSLVTALMQNPDLAKVADKGSLIAALISSAQDGLVPDGKQAAIVVRGGKAVYHPMIGGFAQIAAEHGWTLVTSVVYANDEFDYTEQPPALTHRPVRPGHERGPLVAAYAIGMHRDGRRRQQAVLYAEDVTKRRAKATTQAVWNEWESAMWRKSAGRALFKELPIADRDRVERVLAADLDPVDSAAAVYGPEARHALENPPAPAVTVERADAAASAAGAAGSQPAGDTALPGSPAADLGDSANADAAGRVKAPPDTIYGGLTIAKIAAKGEDGTKFFQWSLEPERFRRWYDRGEVYAQALPVWARHYRPELLAGREEEAA